MIVVEPVEFDQLRKGDVITFVSGGMTVTHRLIDIDKDTRQLTTKPTIIMLPTAQSSATIMLSGVLSLRYLMSGILS